MKLWGPIFFYFLKLRFLKYIPAKYQHKILSRKLWKLRSKIRILRPPLIWACFLIVNSGLLWHHFLTSFLLSLECVDIFTYLACCDSRKKVRKWRHNRPLFTIKKQAQINGGRKIRILDRSFESFLLNILSWYFTGIYFKKRSFRK